MSAANTAAFPRPSAKGHIPLLALAGALGVAAFAIAVHHKPELALVLATGVPLTIALLAWPAASTLLVAFALYSNAPVIAVEFHGVPFIVGASLPLLLAIPLTKYILIDRQPIVIEPVLPLVVLLLVVQLISSLFADDLERSFGEVIAMLLEGLLLFFLMTNVIRSMKTLRQVVWVLLICGSMLGGLSLVQRVTKTYGNDYAGFAQIEEHAAFTSESGRTQRQGGPIGHKNRYAQIMLMVLPLGLACAWGERSKWLRMAAWGAVGLTMVGVAVTFSRGAGIAFFLMIGVMVSLRLISVAQCGSVLLATALLVLAVPQLTDRMMSLMPVANALEDGGAGIAEADGSIRSRAAEVLAAGLMFAEHPLIGVGPGMYSTHFPEYARRVGTAIPSVKVKEEPRRPHILYLGLAAELGISGLGLFLLIVGALMWNLRNVWLQLRATEPLLAQLAMGLFLSVVAYLATGLFLHLAFIRYLWLILALAAAAARIGRSLALETQTQPTAL